MKHSPVETFWQAGSMLIVFSPSDFEIATNELKIKNEINRKIKEIFVFL